MDPKEYFAGLKKKYDAIARGSNQAAPKGVDNTLGDRFHIKDGKIQKQLPKKLIKKTLGLELDSKKFFKQK